MAQSSGMSTREIVQTVRPIAKLAELFWDVDVSDDPEVAQHLFVTDLLKVGLLVRTEVFSEGV